MPVVIMTAFGTAALEAAARRLGAADFVDKPFEPDDLVALVRKNLQQERPAILAEIGGATVSFGHATRRWAEAVVAVVRLEFDVPTERAWGRAIGKSPSSLKRYSALVEVHAADTLDLARGLRVVSQHAGQIVRPLDWHEWLAIVEPPTLNEFLERGRLPRAGELPTVEGFLRDQRFITRPGLITAVMHLLNSFSGHAGH